MFDFYNDEVNDFKLEFVVEIGSNVRLGPSPHVSTHRYVLLCPCPCIAVLIPTNSDLKLYCRYEYTRPYMINRI